MSSKEYVEYLGAGLNASADPTREGNRRIIGARGAQSKLNMFWKEGKVSKLWRILMYVAM